MGNPLRTLRFATTRSELANLLDSQSPARHDLRDEVTVALEEYSYHVGALYFPYSAPETRDHFLPFCGLWLDRPLSNPRMQTQLWTHTAFHQWYGMPLPLGSSEADYVEYRRAQWVAEIHAVLGSEYSFFERFPAARSMFNPSFVSTFDAFNNIERTSPALAAALMMRMQFNGGQLPPEVTSHPAFTKGTAVTLLRQAAWASHDEAWCRANFNAITSEQFYRLFHTLWRVDDHATIHERIAGGVEGLLFWHRQNGQTTDTRAKHAVTMSLLRTIGLYLAGNESMTDADYSRLAELRDCGTPDQALAWSDELYNAGRISDDPMPLWNVATTFRKFRLQWEAELAAKTAVWVSQA